MKASLLAISISSVLVAPAFATAPQVDVELANQQTLQLIDGQMKAVDASVQYKLNEQYANATPGTTATIDDVTYEKQSNGTWAAVSAASAALVAGLLNSSSSSQDSQNPTLPIEATPDNELPMSPTPSHPIAHTPTNPIDKGRPVVDKPTDNTNPIMPIPGTDLVLDSTTGLVTKDGVVVASVERDGLITATINIHGSDDVIKVWYDANGINVDWNNSTIDNGWGHVATPTNPIDKDRPVVDKPTDNTNPIMPIPGTDLVLDSTTGLVTKDGVVVASVERDGLITATINIHGSDDVIKVWYDANGINVDWNNSTIDNGWGHVATPTNPIDKDRPVVDKPTDNTNPIMPIPGTDLVLDSTTGLVTKDGVVVASVERDGLLITATINIHGSDDVIKVWYDANGVNIDWNNSTIDSGWGHVATPTNPIDKDRPVIDKPTDNENNHYQISGAREGNEGHYGYFSVNGEEVAYLEYSDGQLVVNAYDSTVAKQYDVRVIDTENNGSKLVVIGGDNTTEGQLVHINPEGVVTPIDAEKAKSSLQSIDRSKLQSIDPTKLQKAKSTIQQRLRG
eukprot:TRINITY_DN3688_c0_g1_i3.p2 TRINITY_DN3688_c0_g1~~TRINITY_DN3688_c0_g1_i3.p2  ORF type:complete len:566 (+),score=63.58 TRINITY_DN3688_c0_g1_i3:10403-12100(+)